MRKYIDLFFAILVLGNFICLFTRIIQWQTFLIILAICALYTYIIRKWLK